MFGSIGVYYWGLYWDNGRENGNHYSGCIIASYYVGWNACVSFTSWLVAGSSPVLPALAPRTDHIGLAAQQPLTSFRTLNPKPNPFGGMRPTLWQLSSRMICHALLRLDEDYNGTSLEKSPASYRTRPGSCLYNPVIHPKYQLCILNSGVSIFFSIVPI